jgi:hypothetical protein
MRPLARTTKSMYADSPRPVSVACSFGSEYRPCLAYHEVPAVCIYNETAKRAGKRNFLYSVTWRVLLP